MEEPTTRHTAAPGRSCAACRKRKIRCNREQPCSYCTKLHRQCIYPESVSEAQPDNSNDVDSRLARIEASLQRLETRTATWESLQPGRDQSSSNTVDDISAETQVSPEPECGDLTSDEHSRYGHVTSNLWTDLDVQEDQNEQATDLGKIAVASPSVPSHTTSEPRRRPHGLVPGFGFSFMSSDLRQLHPAENRIFSLWQVFLESVDPVLKLIHTPVTQRQIMWATLSTDPIPPAFESLMFSIYYAAVTSMQCSVSCKTLLQEERQDLLDRYRYGLEQALARADFLSAPDVQTLQALTLYLICARQSLDKTYVWTMTGLAIRVATKLGLHRDPMALGLPPFVSEMRRRLWWQICILDVRTAEENDMDPVICEHSFDTELPSNVNDTDLDVDMVHPAVVRRDRTEMLFTLTRFELSYAVRKWVFSPKFTKDNGYTATSLHDKNESVDTLQKTLEERYLQQCDTRVPICFLTVTTMRMVIAKIKLTINHPAWSGSSGPSRDRLLDLVKSSVEIIEYAHTLRSSDKYSRWVWLFQKYIEWDAVAFLLHSLNASPVPALAERAWKAVEIFFHDWRAHYTDEQRWRRLQRLRAKAVTKRHIKSSALETQNEDTPANVTIQQSVEEHAEDISAQTPLVNSRRNATMLAHKDASTSSNPPRVNMHATVADKSDAVSFRGELDWDFDTLPLAMQGAPSWEMDVDEETFASWV
ncbi:hypothetical protein A1O3_01544 [Capronia epimyces CBS 606.96]|uniref:Zn(2)-C6 fungal-type domain-containing protein n=1 Tax=Capronia epimyces CBS 606.96 TaxID=1182542 RepID=W9YKB9_9EURO|nr:uncharacterized protein A1O3_01544 [Capronia epimyces CBS 606.96]EXJ92988.1 hypothetical protein A1O3_01544 [Capronia epimyces CBS 606.96]